MCDDGTMGFAKHSSTTANRKKVCAFMAECSQEHGRLAGVRNPLEVNRPKLHLLII